jgi:predicted MFS family arabinose efflux permease
VPMGHLADRAGRFTTFVGGHAALILMYVILFGVGSGSWPVAAAVVVLGFFYASTDGVLMAVGSAVVRDERRTTGLAILTTVIAVARMSASVIFGMGWSRFGLRPTMMLFSIGLAIAIIVVVARLRPPSELQ